MTLIQTNFPWTPFMSVPGTSVDFFLVGLVGFLLYTFANRSGRASKPPCVNPSSIWDFRNSRKKLEFVQNSKGLLHKGQDAFRGRPFRVTSERGDVTVLPYDTAHDIRNEHSLSFDLAVYDVRTPIPCAPCVYYRKDPILLTTHVFTACRTSMDISLVSNLCWRRRTDSNQCEWFRCAS
jgi:hypothetical protein